MAVQEPLPGIVGDEGDPGALSSTDEEGIAPRIGPFDRRAAAKEPLPPGGALSGIYAAGAAEAPGQAGVPPLVLGGSQRMPSVGAANVVEQRM